MGKFVDLTGMKFGRLTVIKRAENKGKQIHWLCKCECGNEKVIQGCSLKSGKTASCGCLQVETLKKLNEEQWKNDEFRQKHTEKMKQIWENDEFRCKMSDQMKKLNEEQWQDDEFRQKHTEKLQKLWKNDEFRQKHTEKMKQIWENDEFRKMQDEKLQKLWQDDEFRQMQKNKAKKQWKDEDFKKMQSEKGKQKTKDKNPNYKGGITPISQYLRNLQILTQWRKDTYIRENSKCQLTGKHVHGGNSDVHHLKAFSTIVEEAHNLHNIKIKPQVKDYTQEELKLLEEYVGSWHKDTSNAVLLSDEAHNLFHSLYRKGKNTPEQFEEFRERYLAGEFKEILK